MKTRTRKTMGITAAVAAVAASVTLATPAQADPPPGPVIPDPQGPGCDAFKASVPNFKGLATQPVGDVLRAIPEISTFYKAISGGLNPAVNIVPVLNNGPYVVFAPSNEAFAKMPGDQLVALANNVPALFDMDYYHVFLGFLGPDTVAGTRPTQQGAEITVTGSGGDITVNNTAKVICGDIHASQAVIYIIDQVLPVPANAHRAEAPAQTPGTAEAPAGELGAAEAPGATPTADASTPGAAEAPASTPVPDAAPAPTDAAPAPAPTAEGRPT